MADESSILVWSGATYSDLGYSGVGVLWSQRDPTKKAFPWEL